MALFCAPKAYQVMVSESLPVSESKVASEPHAAAIAVAEDLQVGAVSINDASLTGVVNDVEKNSFRFSGMGGSRMGSAGLTRFIRKRALLIQTGEPAAIQLFSD